MRPMCDRRVIYCEVKYWRILEAQLSDPPKICWHVVAELRLWYCGSYREVYLSQVKHYRHLLNELCGRNLGQCEESRWMRFER